MTPWLYTYRAEPVRAVDGDTVELLVDLGMRVHTTIRLRLEGIDTPETRGDKAEVGHTARRQTQAWLDAATGDWPLVVVTKKDRRSFNRYIGNIWNPAGDNLVDHLRELGYT